MTAGTQRRDFMHVADAGAAFAALADCDVTGAVNIACGEGVELREIARVIAARTGGQSICCRSGRFPRARAIRRRLWRTSGVCARHCPSSSR